jgi:glycosyltransferase involved in cell wall biosynthesis
MMMCSDYPFISVVVPAFNAERYLGSCIESVLSQTYLRWELMLVEDGSTDATPEVISAYSAKDPRIRGHHHSGHQNRGVAASRNLAIKNSRGTHIATLDADDEWLPEKLELQLQSLASSPDTDLHFAKTLCVGPDGEPARHPEWPDRNWFFGHAPQPGPVVLPFDSFLTGKIGIPTPTVCARKQAVVDAGGFPENLHYQIEDSALWGMILQSGKAVFLDRVLARYRVHDQNYTASLDSRSTIDSYWVLYSYLEKNTEDRRPAVRNALLGCIDRYLLATDIPFKQRLQLAREHLRYLMECGHISSDRALLRYLTLLPGHLKRRMLYRSRRVLGVGPEPWRGLLFRSEGAGLYAVGDRVAEITDSDQKNDLSG